MLVMFPVALLVTGILFDVVDTVGGPDFLAEVAYWNITVGLVGGLLAAAAGAFDLLAIPRRIPDKGRILTALSLWWFERLADIVPHHVVSTDVPAEYAGRALLCTRLEMYPVECVARGYLTGSGLADYLATGAVCGVPLPAGLVDGSRLDAPVFTPATKAAMGEHDENVTTSRWSDRRRGRGRGAARHHPRGVPRARDIAVERGIVVADTKLELGRDAEGRLVLADEVLTPDSSRFWPAEPWEPGHPQPSYDKQFVRDWLTSPASGWDRYSGEKPPPLPGRRRRAHPREVRRGVRAADRPDLRLSAGAPG